MWCPFCRHEQPIPPSLLAELTRYAAGVQESAARADAHDQASYEQQIEAASNPLTIGAGLVVLGPVVVFGFGNELVKYLELLPREVQKSVDAWVHGLTGIWLGVGTYGYIAYRRLTTERRTRRLAHEPLGCASCPSCGAPTPLVTGQVLDRCRFCGAALAPHTAMIARGLDAARAHERRARLDRYRAERRGSFAIPPVIDGILEAVIIGFCALVSMAAGHAVPVILVREAPSLAPWATILTIVGWIAGTVGALVSIGVLVRHVSKVNAFRIAHAELSARLGGARATFEEARRWVDAYWAAPFEARDLLLSTYGAAHTTVIDGFPVLVVADTGPERLIRTPRIIVCVAAVPRSSTLTVSATLRRNASEHGFIVAATEGGLRAVAESATIERVDRRPAELSSIASLAGAMVASLRDVADPAPAG